MFCLVLCVLSFSFSLFSPFPPPHCFIFLDLFLEFIKCVRGMRWMCCEEVVACYLRMCKRGKEVVRGWLWQPELSRAPRLVFQTRHANWLWALPVALRENKCQQNSKICTRLGPPHPLIDTDTCCLPPPSVAPERVLVCLPRFWGPCVCRATHLHRCWGCNSLTQRCPERSVRSVVSPEGTSCKGTAVQSHPRPLLFCPATCTSERVEKMWEGGREQKDTP